jgi:hypothetical protein
MRTALKKRTGPNGHYYELSFSVGLRFGGTELLAFLEWEQDVSFESSVFGSPDMLILPG